MINKICEILTKKIKKSLPDIDDEKAEIINYGLQNIIGEIPKFFILIGVAYLLGILKVTLITFLVISPYRFFSGGFHLKTHIGCMIMTSLLYCGTGFLGQYVILEPVYIKYILIGLVWIFSLAMITLYAPADTENVPILRKKDRRQKKILSYIVVTIELVIAMIVKDQVISSIIILSMFIQTLTITRFIYRLTKNQYGYEVYQKQNQSS